MGFTYREILEGCVWVCGTEDCGTHLALDENVLSKSFRGATGTAFLFGSCSNLFDGRTENRELLTGTHRVCEVHCRNCNALVGWKYIECYEPDQKYKTGKVVLEKALIMQEHSLPMSEDSLDSDSSED